MNITNHKQELVALKTLKGAEYNPRDIKPEAMAALKANIAMYGLVQPIVARKEDGLIIGGHQRFAALKELLAEQNLSEAEIGAAPVPVILLSGLDDTKTKLLNLALNKISGDWDYDKLSSLFEGLGDLDPGLVQLSGFNADEVSDMMGLLAGAAPLRALSEDLDAQVAEGLAAQARRFNFTVETDEDAALCTEVLREYGMTGPGNAERAFMAVLRAAKKALLPLIDAEEDDDDTDDYTAA